MSGAAAPDNAGDPVRRLVQASFDAVVTWSADAGVIRAWGPGAQALYGWSADEAVGRCVHDLIASTPESRSLVAALAEGGVWSGELRRVGRDGLERVVDAWLVMEGEGEARQVIEAARDLGRSRMADRVLRNTVEFHRQIINSVREGLLVFGPNLRCVTFNRYMETLAGVPAARVIGSHPQESATLARCVAVDALQHALTGEVVRRTEVEWPAHASGEALWVSDEYVPISSSEGDIVGVLVTVRNVTRERQRAEAIRLAGERLDQSLLSARMGAWEADAESNQMVWSRHLSTVLGRPFGEDGTPWSWAELIQIEDRRTVLEAVRSTVVTGEPFMVEFRPPRRRGAPAGCARPGSVTRCRARAPACAAWSATSPRAAHWRRSSSRRRRWRPSASSPAASHTSSTTCSPPSSATRTSPRRA
ncbi:MAG: PAS domain S-box protein [Vicinamibacterales bacterium]